MKGTYWQVEHIGLNAQNTEKEHKHIYLDRQDGHLK